MITFQTLAPNQIPMALLLEADPDQDNVKHYLEESLGFVALEGKKIIGACVVLPLSGSSIQAEIMNVSVEPTHQQQGIGTQLLRTVIDELKMQSYEKLVLGTGTFGYQLTYYQRLGFRVESVDKDHFLLHYPEPIWENGIQHKDMLRLYLDL
ncbi:MULTISPECIES: GNAT family N-acetyltransferase [Vibrio]|uniref:GNAT family N-acetyltransferase n=1 Tax=Vibrio TaxID=662 RepID=UPI0005769FBD|nr:MULTISPECIES: GNAT family N-acetyltransferase [Vibrio]KIP74419.1 GCN5 family acetyltransferase [Vibrio harveyi]MCF6454316.1 GNAT family N-acetyltransferase [Vibrio sp. MMG023]MCX2792641.1 GNAT family N-acetyltransferase [Vibrio sp. Sgm 5]